MTGAGQQATQTGRHAIVSVSGVSRECGGLVVSRAYHQGANQQLDGYHTAACRRSTMRVSSRCSLSMGVAPASQA